MSAESEWEKSVKSFEKERDDFLNLAEDADKREEMSDMFAFESDNPESFEKAKEKLGDAKIWSGYIQSAIEQAGGTVTGINQRAPSGKAPVRRDVGNSENNFKDYIDELYSIKRDPSKTINQKEKADRMLDELFMEVIKGVNVSRRRIGSGLPDYQVNQCPRCGVLRQSPRGQVFDRC